jgi:hypothetical protein
MPVFITKTAGGTGYANPFVHTPIDPAHVKVDVSALSADTGSGGQVDAYGYIKPGTILKSDGTPISGASQVAWGVVFEPTQIPGEVDNSDLAGAQDFLVTVGTGGLLNRDIVEDMLGRAITANELSALDAGNFKYTTT